MRALLDALGDPQRGLPAVHVVGTNGKSTTTRKVEELLRSGGLRVGAYLSPHVRSWAERIRVDGAEADLEEVLAEVRPAAERLEATQFEALTAAALRRVPRGRRRGRCRSRRASAAGTTRRTCSTRRASSCSRTSSLEHTDVLGTTREAIAAEKLAVVRPAARSCSASPSGSRLRGQRARQVVVEREAPPRCSAAARRSSAGRSTRPPRSGSRFPAGSSAGRARSATAPTTPRASGGWSSGCRRRIHGGGVDPRRQGRRGDARARLPPPGDASSRCRSSNPRALPAEELAGRARRLVRASSRPATTRRRHSTLAQRSASRCS